MPNNGSELIIPPSQATVSVKALCPARILKLPPVLVLRPEIPGTTFFDTPCFTFLIEHSQNGIQTRLMFDLGFRKDWREKEPNSVALCEQFGTSILAEKDVNDLLTEANVDPGSIDAIVLSHQHVDHIGDPQRLPTGKIIVGPGFVEAHGPSNPNSEVVKGAFDNKELREVDFAKNGLSIGGFDALDYFEDGSLYLLSTPGHAVGHISALARVHIDEQEQSSFVFLAGDACHHAGEMRPSGTVPMRGKIPSFEDKFCRVLLDKVHPRKTDDKPFYQPAIDLTHHMDTALDTIDRLAIFDADPNVMVLLAHDASLEGVIDMFPDNVDRWKERGWKDAVRWNFLSEFNLPDS